MTLSLLLLATRLALGSGGPDGGTSDAPDAGPQDRELIRRMVRAHVEELRACYEAELVRAADAGAVPTGKLVARWVVGTDGAVTSVQFPSTVPGTGQRFTACVTDAMLGWRFPRPKGGGVAVITYPFVFRPPDAGQP